MGCDINICKAACCGLVPIPRQLYERHKEITLTKKHEIYPIHTNLIIASDDNCNCIFLSDEKLCSIYDERPEVCRRFGEESETDTFLQCEFK